MIHLFGEEGAQVFKMSAVDLNSAFYPSLHFTLSLHFTPGPQSAFYTDRHAIKSPQATYKVFRDNYWAARQSQS